MTAKKETTTWGVLSKIDCSDHVEQKGNLTYLSWAWAWKILKENFPDASFEKHWFDYGDPTPYSLPYALDKAGNAFVKVTVTVDGAAITEVMPVLDNRNHSVQRPNSFLINTSLQRCLTKAIAYHGLGSYIYAGEDTPDVAEEEVVVEDTPAKEDTPAPTPEISQSLEDWRKAFVDTDTAALDVDGVLISQGQNLEGWKRVVSCFETFMPSMADTVGEERKPKYESGADCVKDVENFWKINKKVIAMLKKEHPDLHEGLLNSFKSAKAAAKDGKPFEIKSIAIKETKNG
tara:strand:- start:91 stop:957 length:867 start_codon:yes stop_codon:yes gene_type:complete